MKDKDFMMQDIKKNDMIKRVYLHEEEGKENVRMPELRWKFTV